MEEEIHDTATLPPEIWDLGIHDAHCHPTDTPDNLAAIPSMNARTLTVMATRAWDQNRVAELARQHGVDLLSAEQLNSDTTCRIVPSFGWHPWFSHIIEDDLPENMGDVDFSTITQQSSQKTKNEHYSNVLTPVPPDEFIDQLAEPKPLSQLIEETRKNLEEFPSALVGEVGLDKTFRLPKDPRGWRADAFPEDGGQQSSNNNNNQSQEEHQNSNGGERAEDADGEKPKMLSPHKVQPSHQKRLLQAQLRLAGRYGRPVSVHGVGAHGVLLEAFQELWKGYEREVVSQRTRKRGPHDYEGDDSSSDEQGPPYPFPPRVCLHSFSGPPPFLKQWLNKAHPCEIYFSFSTAINARYGDKFVEVLKNVPEDRLLVESDLHTAGDLLESYLGGIVALVAKVRDWTQEETVKKVGENWGAFVFGKEGRGKRMAVRQR